MSWRCVRLDSFAQGHTEVLVRQNVVVAGLLENSLWRLGECDLDFDGNILETAGVSTLHQDKAAEHGGHDGERREDVGQVGWGEEKTMTIGELSHR